MEKRLWGKCVELHGHECGGLTIGYKAAQYVMEVMELERDEDGRISLSYDETELTGMEGSTTTVTFAEDDPGTVTMLRFGSVTTTLVFEQERRHICVYETPIMPFEICIYARRVQNDLTMDGGSMLLDYLIEIHGAKAERTLFELHVVPTDR